MASSEWDRSGVLEVTVATGDAPLFPELERTIAGCLDEAGIDRERRILLERLSDFVLLKLGRGETARLVFICTHNSRRSQFGQFWARAAARYFAIPGVETFSGGTEATAFNPRAVAALRRAGFVIEFFSDGKNPVFEAWCEPGMEPFQAFSKVYDTPPNPTSGFAAVMTCSSADAACPHVGGADERIAIPYDDPKTADGSERETEVYDARCRQIAREMLYVFAGVARRI